MNGFGTWDPVGYVQSANCAECGGRIRRLGTWPWLHVGAGDDSHPAQPTDAEGQ